MVPSQFNLMPGCYLLANISAFLSSYLLTVPFVVRMQNQKQLCFRNGVLDLFFVLLFHPQDIHGIREITISQLLNHQPTENWNHTVECNKPVQKQRAESTVTEAAKL